MEAAFGASLTLPTGSNRGSQQNTPQKNSPKNKKNWIRVQKPSFWTGRNQILSPRVHPVGHSLVEHLKEIPPGSKKAWRGGRFSTRKRLVLMTNTRGSLGPPKRCFFEIFCFLAAAAFKRFVPIPHRGSRPMYVASDIVFRISDSHMIFIQSILDWFYSDFLHPLFYFYNTHRGAPNNRSLNLHPPIHFAPAIFYEPCCLKDKRLREGVSRAQILLQGGVLIITRIVHHSTIKGSLNEVENLPSLKSTENQN